MNKLKVIQLLPELNIGGVERGTCDFSKALVKNGHKSVVISNGGIYEKDIIQHGGKHINLPIHKKSLFSLLLSKKLSNSLKIRAVICSRDLHFPKTSKFTSSFKLKISIIG